MIIKLLAIMTGAFVVSLRLVYLIGFRKGQAAHFKRLAAAGSRFADPDWNP